MNENPMTNVFVAPSNIRNSFWFAFEIRFPITAACPEPSPGKKLHRGEAIIAPSVGFSIFVLGFFIFCFGMIVLFFIDRIIVEDPKSPVSSGRSGCFICSMFSVVSPSIPVSMNASSAFFLFFSSRINESDRNIRM